MGRNIVRSFLILLASIPVQAVAPPPTPSASQIEKWVRQLDDESFSVRESASKSLLWSGKAAIRAVTDAATGESVEVTDRAMRILEELESSTKGVTASAVREALRELASSKRETIARRARKALGAHQHRVIAALERCGASVAAKGDKFVSVNFDDAKALGRNLRLLRELPDVERLSFSTPLMDDAGMAEIKGLKRLRVLNLYGSRVGDEGLKHLKTFPSLRSVPMGGTRVTDKGLAHLKDLNHLEYVGLRGNQVTDEGLVHLKGLTGLTGLYLGETKVTDAGLIHLRGLTKLTMLYLDQTVVGDAGLRHLEDMTELLGLYLFSTRVTSAGVAKLKKALPKVGIILDNR
jgi:hypothetical protein